MVAPLIKSLCLKCILPASLLFAAILRPCLLSSVYVLLALLCPLLPSIEPNLPVSNGIRVFTLLSLIYCTFTLIAQSAYQITEKVIRPGEETYRLVCNKTGIEWLRYTGLIRFKGGDQFESARTIMPEIVSFIFSTLTFVLVNLLFHRSEELDMVGDVQQIRDGAPSPTSGPEATRRPLVQLSMTLRRLSNVLIIILAAVLGSIQPSLLSLLYFLCFLFISTWWSLYKPLRHETYNKVKSLILGWLVIHILAVYLYQIPFFQTWLPPDNIVARLIGLSPLFIYNCDRWWAFPLNTSNEWPVFASPVCLLLYYYLLIVQLIFTRNGCRAYFEDDETHESSVHEENSPRTASTGLSSTENSEGHRPRGATLLLPAEDHDTSGEQAEQAQGIPMRKVTAKVVDRHKISQIFRGERDVTNNEFTVSEGFVVPAIFYCLRHAYSLSLMAIMVWALLYHSIFGLILLICGCVLWMFKDTRSACFRLAPILLTYVEVLLILQYFCSMDWKPEEINLPNWCKMLGIISASSMENAFITLLVKVLLSLPVFLLLRLALRERYYDALSEHERTARLRTHYGTFNQRRTAEATERRPSTDSPSVWFSWLSNQLAAVWIFVVAGVLLIVATQKDTVIYTIGFFVIWSLLIIYFKISLRLFRGIAYIFWLGTIIYTAAVIIALYVYQFPDFPNVWIKLTGLSKEWNDDIGLINYADRGEKGSLFVRLLWPILLFLVTTLQLKFFHGRWLKMVQAEAASEEVEPVNRGQLSRETRRRRVNQPRTSSTLRHVRLLTPCEKNMMLDSMTTTSSTVDDFLYIDDEDMAAPIIAARPQLRRRQRARQWKATLTEKATKVVNEFLELVWRITEVHISKIVFIIVAVFVAYNICALYFPLIVLVSLALCLPNAAAGLISLIMCAYLAVIAVFKMIYQLEHIPDFGKVTIGGDCNATQNFSEWIGVKKAEDTWKLLNGLVVAMVALGIQSVVVYRQRHMRIRRGESEDLKKLIFPGFTIRDFDRSFFNAVKFLMDYGFFKFGLECSMILMGIDAWVRMDFLGAVMCIWLAFFALSKRAVCRNTWPIFVLYLSIILPIQYALYVGLPQESCVDYPWSHVFDNPISNSTFPAVKNTNFHIWAGLSDYFVTWPPQNIIIDFFLLLAASCQLTIFRIEGEDNDSIYPDENYYLKPENPHYDFIAEQKSMVDFVKIAIFHYGHWVTLIAALIAGIGGTSFFALGYIVITFWILWEGNNLYVMNAESNSFKSTLARWKTLLSYTTFTLFCKVALQVVGCVFLEQLHNKVGCVVRQLFSIDCVNNIVQNKKLFVGFDEYDKQCPVTTLEAQIGFDVVALGFLLFQMRCFHSWYFQHCMVEYRSEILLANRYAATEDSVGGVLKNQLIEKEMKEQNIQQQEKFDEIRRRTDAIRERYNKQQARGVVMFEPETYGQESWTPSTAGPSTAGPISAVDDHSFPAKRAGDYYMFDYDPSTDELIEPVESFVPEADPTDTQFDKLDPGQLVYVAGSRDERIGETLKAIEEAEKNKDNFSRMSQLVAPVDTHVPGRVEETSDIEVSLVEEVKKEDSKILGALRFVKKILCNGMDMISVQLNKMSREHRYVAFVLAKEKEKMKETEAESLSNTSLKLTDIRNQMDIASLRLVQTEKDIEKMENEAQNKFMKRSSIARLINAIGNCVAANTDTICYFLAVMSQVMGGGLITLPLPLMVFFWGTLSNPRPSKVFWVAMISYTEFVVVCKFIFQFNIWEFNKPDKLNVDATEPLAWPKALGLQRQNNFASFDVPLLFALFFHRYMLRKFGLWKDANLTVTFQEESLVNGGIADSVTMETIAHSRSSSSNDPTTSYHTAVEAPPETTVAVPEKKDTTKKNPIARFIDQLFHPKFRYIRDLYPIMFGLDVIAFLIVAFGYSSFGEGGSGNVIGDIQKNRIPMTLVVMLMVFSFMIVIDRGLYLRKWVYGKLAYQLLVVVFLHAWIFFVLPTITKRGALENPVASALYVFKCLYLLVSAWQIRNGYPQLCIGNLLTHAYGLANMVFFKIFMAVPFLFELRTAIDWTWTDTSMPLFDFFNMENFYATIYNLKCARTFEANYPAPRGQPKGVIVKYFMGVPMILAIILLVWLPLLMFALLNQIGDVKIPDRVTLTVSIEGYPPLYQIEAQGGELRSATEVEKQTLTDTMSKRFTPNNQDSLKRSRNTVAFLKDYTDTDMLIVSFRPESEIFWLISEDSLKALIAQLKNPTKAMKYQIYMEFSRPYDPEKKVAAKHTYLKKYNLPDTQEGRDNIIAAINSSSPNATIFIPISFPSYTLVPNEGEVTYPEPLISSIVDDQPNFTKDNSTELPIWLDNLYLEQEGLVTGGKVWAAKAIHPTEFSPSVFFNASDVSYAPDRKYLQTVAFIDRAYPSLFAKYLQGGVITMYVSLIIVIGRLLRGVFTSSPADIMISEIPNPDYMLKICLDIYLVREAKDFYLEQDLFAKLIFLFRSPATLIQWTRYKVKND